MVKTTRKVDAALVVVALLFGLAHVAYPLAREHAATAYAGREWLLHGTAPYAGSFVQDGPGLVFLSGVATILGGGSGLPLRLLSLVAAVVTGLVAPFVVMDASARKRVPAHGSSALAASLFAHGYFDFWDSARGGTFVAAAIVGSLALARTSRRTIGSVVAGALAAAAFLVRPTAWVLVPVVLVVVLARGPRLSRAGAFVLGVGALLGAFALALGRHGLSDAYDLLWDGRCLYLGPPRIDRGSYLFSMQDAIGAYEPHASTILVLFGCGLGYATFRRDVRRVTVRLLVLLVGGATLSSILLLRKYYFDFESMTAFVALAFACLTDDAITVFPSRARAAVLVLAGEATFLFVGTSLLHDSLLAAYPQRTGATIAYTFGIIDKNTYQRTFERPEIGFFPLETEEVARFVGEHSQPEDSVLVRGFEPQVYLSSRRRYRGRFFVTPALVWEGCSYRRTEWLREDTSAFTAEPRPKLVVAIVALPGPDAADTFRPLGYAPMLTTAHYVVLARQ